MGLLKATKDALGTTLANQWLEYITVEETSSNILVQRGYPKRNGSNTKSTKGVLTKGTKIAVPEGMAMMIIDQGKVTEFTAEPGEFIYDNSTESSIFYGGFGKGIIDSVKKIGDNFKYGGQPATDQRVYYINTKEIQGLTFGTAEPMPFMDPKYDITLYLRFFGKYSIQVKDPIILISNIIGSASQDIVTTDIFTNGGQLKEEFMTSLTSALATLAHEESISFNELPRYQKQLAKLMNDELDEEWLQTRGIEVISVAIPSVSLTEQSKEDVRKYDEIHIATKNGKGVLTAATAQAMKDAAKNEGGTVGTFMGMNIGSIMGSNMNEVAQGVFGNNSQSKEDTSLNKPLQWKCPNCQTQETGSFCSQCGASKPTKKFCSECGKELNLGNKFCSECGKKIE
ncbi:MAG: zinc-ribbon domain-containing protein [Clostridia bacterium]|jgi:membrane protease subunit (stomatin/prohibitin family)|nr:zinc-ribbon domain-containing protein [Clostridia bacterium]